MTNHKHHAQPNKRPSGLTLIELVVAMMIIALLAAIAYPSYMSQVRKSKRAVAKNALLDAANRQEQYFFANRAYANAMNLLPGYTTYSDTTIDFNRDGTPTTVSADAVYTVSVAAVDVAAACGTAPCFQLMAVPKNDQTNDTACGTYTLTSSNKKEPDPATSDCW